MKIKELKTSVNAFVSGVLISTLSVVPVLNVSASTSLSSVPYYFGTYHHNAWHYYYNHSSIITGKNVANEPFATAVTSIARNDDHYFIPGEVGLYSRLYNHNGVLVKESANWVTNGSNNTTFFDLSVMKKNLPTNIGYYSKGITEAYYTATDPQQQTSPYVIEYTFPTTAISDFTY